MVGNRYTRLVVLDVGDYYITNEGKRQTQWWCQCDCGNIILVRQNNLKSGNTKSCGCYKSDQVKKGKTTHGHSRNDTVSSTYCSWWQMVQRCTNQNIPAYERYGRIGVIVCDRWLNSFDNFLEDMGERPRGTSLNRKINHETRAPHKLYSKENCEWASRSVQAYDQKIRRTNLSGKTGVYWSKHHKKWFAQLSKDGETHRLGCFTCIDDAIRAREEAEIKYYGYLKQ